MTHYSNVRDDIIDSCPVSIFIKVCHYRSASAKRHKNGGLMHSGKSATIRESNHGSGVGKEHYAWYYEPKSSILLAGTGVWKISSVAWAFSSIKIDYSDYPKSLISRINDIHGFFSIKYRNSDILLKTHKHNLTACLLQSNLLLCEHSFCDVSVMLYNVSVTLSPALSK